MKYKAGTILLCINDFYMKDSHEKVFTKGRKYMIIALEKSAMTASLCYSFRDDFEPNHLMSDSDITGYFIDDTRERKLKRILNI